MAGTGPAPKDPSERRNKTPPMRGEWVDLKPLEAPVLPDLPARADGEWSEMTRSTWAAWRADPVTSQWTSADIAYALDTIRLYEGMSPSSASEVRLRMDGLGLTPKGKRDLRWRPPAPDTPATATPAKRAKSGGNRRARLSVVA